MGIDRSGPSETLGGLLARYGESVHRWHVARGRRLGIGDRGALALAHLLAAEALTPWQLARSLSLGSAETFELVEALERDGWLTRVAAAEHGARLLLRPTPLARAALTTPSAPDPGDAETRALLTRFLAGAVAAAEQEAERAPAASAPADAAPATARPDEPAAVHSPEASDDRSPAADSAASAASALASASRRR